MEGGDGTAAGPAPRVAAGDSAPGVAVLAAAPASSGSSSWKARTRSLAAVDLLVGRADPVWDARLGQSSLHRRVRRGAIGPGRSLRGTVPLGRATTASFASGRSPPRSPPAERSPPATWSRRRGGAAAAQRAWARSPPGRQMPTVLVFRPDRLRPGRRGPVGRRPPRLRRGTLLVASFRVARRPDFSGARRPDCRVVVGHPAPDQGQARPGSPGSPTTSTTTSTTSTTSTTRPTGPPTASGQSPVRSTPGSDGGSGGGPAGTQLVRRVRVVAAVAATGGSDPVGPGDPFGVAAGGVRNGSAGGSDPIIPGGGRSGEAALVVGLTATGTDQRRWRRRSPSA